MIKKNYIWGLGIFALVVSIMAISGCTSNTTQTLNYTDSFISFQYPSDFQNTTYPGDLASGDSGWKNVAFMANNQSTDILMGKNSIYPSGTNQEEIGQITANTFRSYGWNILGSARLTNPNGIPMWKITNYVTDPASNTDRYYETVFFMQGSNIYEIQIYGDKSKQTDVQTAADTVINSIAINKG